MIEIKYYRGLNPSPVKEKVVQNVFRILRDYLHLPNQIQVQFVCLSEVVFAETVLTTGSNVSVLRINIMLSPEDIIIPLVHELIHLEQINTGKLKKLRTGLIEWEGKKFDLAKLEYNKHPWEADVDARLPDLLKIILKDKQ